VHELHVLGQRFAERLGHRLGTTVGHQSATDLRLDLLLELLDPVLVLVVLEPFLQGVSSPPTSWRVASINLSSMLSRSRFRSVR
jgi:hypothetical protein